MTGSRLRPAVAALVVALVLVVSAPASGLLEPATARGAGTDLTLVTDATYTVRPEQGDVAVSVAIAARNHTRETRTRKFWFDHAFLAVQPGAAGLRLTGPKGARVRVAGTSAQATLLRIDFGSRLYSGKGAAFRLSFHLPGRGRTASPQVRVGSSLVTLPVWAYASDGARGSSVSVRFPPGWDVAVESGDLPRRTTSGDGGTVLSAGPLAAPLRFFAYVTAQRPAVYVDRPLTVQVGDRSVELLLQAWKDDPGWAERTGDLFARALPVLHDEIGLPWPSDEPLVVQEAVSRDADAYAGLYDPAANLIEVAYWADRGVAIHQAAHGWFNGSLLGDRWANEGFATYYALRTAAALGEPSEAPVMTAEAEAAAFPLNEWAADTGSGAATPADLYGYAASLALVNAVADRIGDDVLSAVWADAAGGIGAYQPPGTAPGATPEGIGTVPDWRGLLDLLEAHSGEDLAGLWRESVVRPDQAPLLDARAAARASYGRTLALAGDWELPRAIRDALRAWDFAAAEALMADARTVLAQRDAVVEMAGRDGLQLGGATRSLFEGGSMTEASTRAQAERAAILAIERASAARTSDDDVLSRIGMLGEDPAGDIAEAEAALAAGDLEAVLVATDRAHRAWTAAWQEGRRRALLALAVLATIVVLGSAFGRNLRRSRRAGPATPGDATTPS